MLKNIFEKTQKLPLVVHGVLAVAALAGFRWVQPRLDASYAASNHPEDYMTGQTRFSGPEVKEYYAHMIEAGTLDIYWQTQVIDFGFIAAIFCLGLFLCTLIARLGRIDSLARRIGNLAGFAVVMGAVFDAVENGISFIMLANPLDFANWLALPYSGFAVVKFGLITLGMLGVVVCVALVLFGRILRRAKLG